MIMLIISLIILFVCGLLIWVFEQDSNEAPEGSKEKKFAENASFVCAMIAAAVVILWGLYLLGCIWYYFCGGFLACDSDFPFFERIIYGLISLLPLGVVVSIIAVCFGYDPKN